jgi:hypothetical protein
MAAEGQGKPQLPVWANSSILYGLVEIGNRSAAPRRRMLQLTNRLSHPGSDS